VIGAPVVVSTMFQFDCVVDSTIWILSVVTRLDAVDGCSSVDTLMPGKGVSAFFVVISGVSVVNFSVMPGKGVEPDESVAVEYFSVVEDSVEAFSVVCFSVVDGSVVAASVVAACVVVGGAVVVGLLVV
jgi:hypothetical protein